MVPAGSQICLTVISFCVSVPVLSVQTTVAAPSDSAARSRLSTARRRPIARMPSAIVNVTTAGVPDKLLTDPVSKGVSISRSFLDAWGDPYTTKTYQQGDSYIVALRIECFKNETYNLVVADLLPAQPIAGEQVNACSARARRKRGRPGGSGISQCRNSSASS